MLLALQALRAFAALSVVLYHTREILSTHFPGGFVSALFNTGNCGVYAFFTLSGFVMFHIHGQEWGFPQYFKRFVLKRLVRIYPLYSLITLLLLPFWMAVESFGQPYHKQLIPLVKSLILWPQDHPPHLNVAWTLIHEMLFYGLFGLGILNRRLGLGLFMGWFLSLTLYLYLKSGGLFQELVFNPLNFLFFLGMAAAYVSRLKVIFLKASGHWFLWGGGLAFFATQIIQARSATFNLATLCVYGLSTSFILLGAQGEGVQRFFGRRNFGIKSLLTVGDASYAIYLIHYPALSLLRKVQFAAGLPFAISLGGALVQLFVYALIVTGVGIAVYVTLDKPLMGFAKKGVLRFSSRNV